MTLKQNMLGEQENKIRNTDRPSSNSFLFFNKGEQDHKRNMKNILNTWYCEKLTVTCRKISTRKGKRGKG